MDMNFEQSYEYIRMECVSFSSTKVFMLTHTLGFNLVDAVLNWVMSVNKLTLKTDDRSTHF